jgi:hypothetical protein
MQMPGAVAGRFSYSYLHFQNPVEPQLIRHLDLLANDGVRPIGGLDYEFGCEGYATALVSELPTPL